MKNYGLANLSLNWPAELLKLTCITNAFIAYQHN